MKPAFSDVWITNSSGDNISLETFANSPHAQNPAGQLFIALLEENTWSKDIGVSVHVRSEPRGVTVHSSLLPSEKDYRTISIREQDGAIASPYDVAKLVLEKIWHRMNSIESSMQDMRDLYQEVNQGADAIMIGLGTRVIRKRVPFEYVNEKNGRYFRGLIWVTDKEKRITYFVKREELLESSTPPIYRLEGDASDRFKNNIGSYTNLRDSTIVGATIVS